MTLQLFPSLLELSRAAAEQVVQLAHKAVQENGRFSLCLSGGNTPETLYRLLATPPSTNQMPWAQTHLFWGDERLVPPNTPGSNFYQIQQLLLPFIPIPPEQVHRAKGELAPVEAVADYTHQLGRFAAPAPWPRFDLVLLGMGNDGHTASLFPGPISAEELTRPVIAVTADYDGRPAQRISLTPLVFNQAHHILFLLIGKNKQETLTAVLHGPHLPQQYPAQRIQPHNGTISWMIGESTQ